MNNKPIRQIFPKSGSSLVFLAWQTLLLWHGEGQEQLFKCFVVFLRYLGQVREASGSMQQPTAHPTLPHSPPGTHPFLPKSGSSLVFLAWQTLLLWHGEGQGQLFKCFVVFLRYL